MATATRLPSSARSSTEAVATLSMSSAVNAELTCPMGRWTATTTRTAMTTLLRRIRPPEITESDKDDRSRHPMRGSNYQRITPITRTNLFRLFAETEVIRITR